MIDLASLRSAVWPVVRGAALAAALTAVGYMAHAASGLDPVWSGLVTAVCAALVHEIRRASGNAGPGEPTDPPPLSPA